MLLSELLLLHQLLLLLMLLLLLNLLMLHLSQYLKQLCWLARFPGHAPGGRCTLHIAASNWPASSGRGEGRLLWRGKRPARAAARWCRYPRGPAACAAILKLTVPPLAGG